MQDYGFENLLSVLKKAGDIKIESRVKTFFDVTGFPHYENVISNILAFFFDTNEEHGFKDLWLKSLFECYNSVANTHFQLGEFEEIEREHSTDDNKRLDIIISLDNSIVAIENKIYASPYNPFDSYHTEILKYHKDSSKCIIEILLSLKKENNQRTKYNTVFYDITYKSLIEQVKKNIGNYIENANEKWLLFMKEVLNNIENLGERDSMNKEWQVFLKENGNNIAHFFENYSKDIQSKICFIKDLEQGIKDRLNDSKLTIGTYNTQNCESFKGYFSLYIDIHYGDNTIVIEPYVPRQNPTTLVLELWARNSRKYDWTKELVLLTNDFPDAMIVDDGSWGQCLRLENLDFEKGIVLETLIGKIVGIIQVINS